jgi:hypothetical protein
VPATIAVREVHPDLPVDQAWQQGRRLYARCGRHSHLSGELHALGAKWDVKEGALWIGSGKRDRFTPLALDHQERVARAKAVRSAGHWVRIPYDAVLIRTRIKDMGGIWDEDGRRWALPTPADHMEILEMLQVWERACEIQRAEQAREREEQSRERHRQREIARRHAALEEAGRREALEAAGFRERERRQAARRDADYRLYLATAVGRSLTGQVETFREAFPQFTTGTAARQAAAAVGDVLRLQDGRRALVTARTVGQSNAHWYAEYALATVAPTEDELDTEMRRAAARIDGDEVRALVADASLLSFPAAGDHWTDIADPEGVITVTTGVNGLIPAGHLILARDGTLWWQHPGNYDDYVRAEGNIRDPGLAAFMRRILAGGPRARTLPGRVPVCYTVVPGA